MKIKIKYNCYFFYTWNTEAEKREKPASQPFISGRAALKLITGASKSLKMTRSDVRRDKNTLKDSAAECKNQG